MKITVHLVLWTVAVLLLLAAALVSDGHIDMGSAAVLSNVGLAAGFGGFVAQDVGH